MQQEQRSSYDPVGRLERRGDNPRAGAGDDRGRTRIKGDIEANVRRDVRSNCDDGVTRDLALVSVMIGRMVRLIVGMRSHDGRDRQLTHVADHDQERQEKDFV